MAKVQRNIEIEETYIKSIHEIFGGTVKLSYVINELLHHFHDVLHDHQVRVAELMRDAAERTYEDIK